MASPPEPSSEYLHSVFMHGPQYSGFLDSAANRSNLNYRDSSFIRPFSSNGPQERSSLLDPFNPSCDLCYSSDCDAMSNPMSSSMLAHPRVGRRFSPRSRVDYLKDKRHGKAPSADRATRVYSSDSQSDFLSSDTVSPDLPA